MEHSSIKTAFIACKVNLIFADDKNDSVQKYLYVTKIFLHILRGGGAEGGRGFTHEHHSTLNISMLFIST